MKSTFQNAGDLAARSLCIVLASRPSLKSWPFMAAPSAAGARAEARSTRGGGAAAGVVPASSKVAA